MLTKMDNVGPSLTALDLQEFEQRLGYLLPEEYKTFLLQYNGGTPIPNTYKIVGWTEPCSLVNEFNGIIPDQYNDIEENIELLEGRLPNGFIPIADDPGGSSLLLSVDKDTYGKVYYWDHENEPYDGGERLQDYPNIFFVADSFSDLLDQLYKFEG